MPEPLREADAAIGDPAVHGGDEATVADALEETADEVAATRPDPLTSPHRTRIVAVPLVAALLFFFGPVAAFMLGDRADEIDNRPLASMPSAGQGWSFFEEFTTWANDHLPLRSDAVQHSAELSEAVFDEPPPARESAAGDGVVYPRVIRGSDGWLYFGGDVSGVCNPAMPVDEVVGSLERLNAAIDASGRTLVLAIAPDKSTVVPEHLPDRFAGQECAAERKDAFWTAVTSSRLPLVDLREPLEQAQERTGTTLYRKTDSHWTPLGAAVLVEQIVGRLDPGLLRGGPSPFVEGDDIELRGDLGAMIGRPSTDTTVEVSVQRPGVTLTVAGQPIEPVDVPGTGSRPATVDVSSTDARLYPGRTAVLGDSFFGSARPLFAPFFDEVSIMDHQADPAVMAQLMVDSDTIVVELVERSVAAGKVTLARPDAVAVIEQALAAAPPRP